MSTKRKERIKQLARAVQSGGPDKLPALWEEVERLVAYWADKYAKKQLHGVEFEDLYQCGYIAMARAAETYNGTDSFPNWLYYYYRSEVAALAGLHTEKQRAEPIRAAASLSAPIGEDEDTTLEDTIPDPQNAYEDIERKIYIEQLRAELNRQLDSIQPACAAVIKEHYFQGKTFASIGGARECSAEWVRQMENKGLRALRKPTHRRALEQFIELTTPYYWRVNAAQFRNTHTSATENAVLYREKMRGNI